MGEFHDAATAAGGGARVDSPSPCQSDSPERDGGTETCRVVSASQRVGCWERRKSKTKYSRIVALHSNQLGGELILKTPTISNEMTGLSQTPNQTRFYSEPS